MKNAALLTMVVLMCASMSFAQTKLTPNNVPVTMAGGLWEFGVSDDQYRNGAGDYYFDLTQGDVIIETTYTLEAEMCTNGPYGAAPSYLSFYAIDENTYDSGNGSFPSDYAKWYSSMAWGDTTTAEALVKAPEHSGSSKDGYSMVNGVYDSGEDNTVNNFTTTIGYDAGSNTFTVPVKIVLSANKDGSHHQSLMYTDFGSDGTWDVQTDGSGNEVGMEWTGDVTNMHLYLEWNDWSWDDGTTDAGSVELSDITLTQVPEPMTMSLLGLGGLGMLIRRKK